MLQTSVNIGRGLVIKNPVMTASGTFGYGTEYADFIDLNRLGGIMVKGTTLHPRQGNPYPRMAETPSGMLNAVGLQNKGVDYFCQHIYPQISAYDTAMIVNVSGSQVEDYIATAEKINDLEHIPAIELNISCPNVKEGGMAFGVTCAGAAAVVRAVREVYDKTLIVKLSPNVTDITEIARAVEAEGADSSSMINTLLGIVWQTAQAVQIQIIGMGGIATAIDAIEFLLAGATAIEVGTYNFVDPTAPIQILEGIEAYMQRHGFTDIKEIIGALEIPKR